MTTMRASATPLIVLLTAVLAFAIGRDATMAQGAQSIWDGVYTAEQATRGKAASDTSCASCHGATLEGADFGPSIAGAEFLGRWDGEKLSVLAAKVEQTMPLDSPGSLSQEAYADILAHMLQASGVPAGQTALALGSPSLETIVVRKTK
ncbi:MAG: c-type cytochrome [Vicinamibacterales bacterium]